MSNIDEIIIDDFDHLLELFNKTIYKPNQEKQVVDYECINKFHSTMVYRGHKEESYKLESSLERHIRDKCPKAIITDQLFEIICNEYLKYCKNELKGKIQEQYILEYDDDVWALGQHYGLKTPLLDWTRSFLVALYFAFEDPYSESEYRVLYQLDCFIKREQDLIIEPKFQIGSRISAQKGVFTKLLSTELENINDFYANSDFVDVGKNYRPLKKYKIKSSLREDAMNFLNSLNIDCYTIYPDLKGAIKNCHIQLDNILNQKKEVGIYTD